jgi:glycosyltransferase involved in cell wall biosynthesis
MHLLVGINGNPHEWQNTLNTSFMLPRLPLPYAFGAAFHKSNHQVSAVDFNHTQQNSESQIFFQRIYSAQQLSDAIDSTDFAILWARQGINAAFKEISLSPSQRRILLASYVWNLSTLKSFKQKILGLSTHGAARFSRALVVMTQEQKQQARESLPAYVPVISFTCGIDTQFYRIPSCFSDVPENYRVIVNHLLEHPYIIMPGDEQRCNQDALDIVANSDLRLVRIAQYSTPAKSQWIREQVETLNIKDRCFFFERISYPFLRFLLQHASAYAGLVDSTWQPAGWTVACEALASGLPVVIYEGLTSRELQFLNADPYLSPVAMGDKRQFKSILESHCSKKREVQNTKEIQEFAKRTLDLEITSRFWVKQVEELASKD